ncbi:MAG: class I SAM-dependent methyltransferase [Chloroflexota bacterium]
MKTIHCNFCHQQDSTVIARGPDLLLDIAGDFKLVKCKKCGLIYQNPQLSFEELKKHYPDDYLPYRSEANESQQSMLDRISQNHGIQRQCQRVINKRPSAGTILDVGCATGYFLKAMAEKGWTAKGVEPSAYASAYAREQLQLDVQTGVLADYQSEEKFDVITLWDVLEHVNDPLETLQQARQLLKPNGLIVISLPNPSGIEAALFGNYWVGWERPRHLFLFTPKLIQAYLEKTGYRFLTIESFNGRLSLTLLSLEFWLRDKKIPEQRWRPWLKLMYSWPFRIGTWPLYKLLESLNKTSVMTVFAEGVGLETAVASPKDAAS